MNKNVNTGFYNYKDAEIAFNYYTDISPTKKMSLISNVADIVVRTNYYSFLVEPVLDFMIIHYFTDVDTKECIDDIDKMIEFVEQTNISDIVIVNMKDGLYEQIKQSVDDNIEYKTGIHRDYLTDLISNFFQGIHENLKSIDVEKLQDKISELTSMKENLTMDKLVESYTKSDAFNNKQAEIIKAKNEEIKELRAKNNAITAKNVLKDD